MSFSYLSSLYIFTPKYLNSSHPLMQPFRSSGFPAFFLLMLEIKRTWRDRENWKMKWLEQGRHITWQQKRFKNKKSKVSKLCNRPFLFIFYFYVGTSDSLNQNARMSLRRFKKVVLKYPGRIKFSLGTGTRILTFLNHMS